MRSSHLNCVHLCVCMEKNEHQIGPTVHLNTAASNLWNESMSSDVRNALLLLIIALYSRDVAVHEPCN